MNTSRTNKSPGTVFLMCWFAMTGVALGQGTIVAVPHLGGGNGQVYALNNTGAVTGFAFTSSGEQHAFLFSGGVLQDLGTLGGLFSSAVYYGNALNDSGVVTGNADLPDDAPDHAFVYQNGVMTDLSSLDPNQ